MSGYGNMTFERCFKSGDDIEHGRLATAGGSQQANELAAVDIERDAISRNDLSFRGFKNDSDVVDVNLNMFWAEPVLRCRKS